MKEIVELRRQEAIVRLNTARRMAGAAAKAYLDDPSRVNKINRAACRRLVDESKAMLEEWTAETKGTI